MLCLILFLFGFITICQCQDVLSQLNKSNSFNQSRVMHDEIPFQVSLYILDSGFLFGSGCLIHPQYVVTAAHCVQGQHYKQVAVVADMKQLMTIKDWQVQTSVFTNIRLVEKIIVHPHYNRPQVCHNDIALIKLLWPFLVEKGIARLPSIHYVNNTQIGIVFGYGQVMAPEFPISDLMLKTNATVTKLQACRTFYQEMSYNIIESQVCAHDTLLPPIGFRVMDSGSPLVIDNILIGIQSCAPGVSPGKKQLPIFTRVFPYISWINRETGEERPNSEVYSSKIIFT